jgi:DNA primase
VNRALNGGSMGTPEGRARAAEAALAVIAEHPSDLVRDQYLMEVASRTQIDPERLRADATRRRHAPAGRGPTGGRQAGDRQVGGGRNSGGDERGSRSVRGKMLPVDRGGAGSSYDGDDWGSPRRRPPARENAELEALRLLIINPDAISGWLHDVMFADDRALAGYRALVRTGAVREAIESSEPGAAELLQRLAAEDSEADPADVVDLLIAAASRRELAEFEAQARHGEDPLAFAADTGWVKLRLEELQEGETREGAREQLLAWLIQEPEQQA